jgi:hypothetical protein
MRSVRKLRVWLVMVAARFIRFIGMAKRLILLSGLVLSLSGGLLLRMWLGFSINQTMGRVIALVRMLVGERMAKRNGQDHHQGRNLVNLRIVGIRL